MGLKKIKKHRDFIVALPSIGINPLIFLHIFVWKEKKENAVHCQQYHIICAFCYKCFYAQDYLNIFLLDYSLTIF